jgi:uncharacterized protein
MEHEEGRVATGCDRTTKAVGRPTAGPKRWKEFLITVAGVYPLTILIPIVVRWLAYYVPPLRVFVIGGLVSATFLVSVLMFVFLPLFHKLFRKWLN